ncbi:VOC family protein [Sorangium sp. So ce131]|uniref:VOC family protein n=1 Tax=Sorangium sp. So ce131 TaxID=3133282 RepID=UPI003F5E630C
MMQFCRFQLRTSNVTAARAFYAAVLGEGRADILALPEEAAARGAPAHWLGYIGVDDVEGAVRAFVERGATRLGPTRLAADGSAVAILRDPGQAVVAVTTPPSTPSRADVVWYQLYSTDVARAVASYQDVFGWRLTERLDLGALGFHQQFAWGAADASMGSMVETTALPGVHPHWLFHFRVPSLDSALAAVRAAGGLVVGPTVLPDGSRVAVCEDPQRGAFALRE